MTRSLDTSRIAWAKLLARVGEEFPLECPKCGGDIWLIAFINEPGPIRKILTHLGEPLEPPPISPARGPPTDWGELVQVHDARDIYQASPNELPALARPNGDGFGRRRESCQRDDQATGCDDVHKVSHANALLGMMDSPVNGTSTNVARRMSSL